MERQSLWQEELARKKTFPNKLRACWEKSFWEEFAKAKAFRGGNWERVRKLLDLSSSGLRASGSQPPRRRTGLFQSQSFLAGVGSARVKFWIPHLQA